VRNIGLKNVSKTCENANKIIYTLNGKEFMLPMLDMDFILC